MIIYFIQSGLSNSWGGWYEHQRPREPQTDDFPANQK